MSVRNLFAPILMTFLLAVSFFSLAPVFNAASAGQSVRSLGEKAKNNVVGIKRRGRGQRKHLPIVPYIAYDYPYYYSRGFYPTHIGPGYIYKSDLIDRRGYDHIDHTGVPHSAIERCSRRFRSFKRDTGLYTTYRGKKKLCPYLR